MGQVNAAFPGIGQFRNLTIVEYRGTQPGYAQADIIPQSSIPYIEGTLSGTDGIKSVSLFNARVDQGSLELTANGHVQRLRFLDRRWRWRFGAMFGEYNVYRSDGSIEPGTEKDTRALLSLCFDAVLETGYDVSAIPLGYPHVVWDGEIPASVIEDICRLYGCEPTLDVEFNIARIVRLGVGIPLPADGTVVSVSHSVDISEAPGAIVAGAVATIFQARFELEPVGLDTDGQIKPIDELSYTPSGGWLSESDPRNLLADSTDKEAYALANYTVFRWFRIKAFSDGTNNLPGYDGTITDLRKEVLPLRRELVQDDTADGVAFERRPYVFGTFIPHSDPPALENAEDEIVAEGFSLDRERGIARFPMDRPMVKYPADGEGFEEPDLYLVAAFHVNHPDTRARYRYGVRRVISSNNTADELIERADLTQTVVVTYDADLVTPNGTTDNTSAIEGELNLTLDGAEQRYATKQSYGVVYNCTKLIGLDGARSAVVWRFRTDAPKGASTVASWNTEALTGVLRRRDRERAIAAEVLDKGRARRAIMRRKRQKKEGV